MLLCAEMDVYEYFRYTALIAISGLSLKRRFIKGNNIN